ncbi:peptide ABC transporter ATP-binding protein [Mesorhizobium soli]|uniref:Peptide ABC transporter ATP-binding protein n=2 Tax=Pseudaminobacter soli (ex Li et al. 2025) TaxID=1295366 RepID=A0A2P7SKZ0_9HYPH|nr:peptide ABC transporter ATP-binding protein [Mesorhizobium soli]
MEQTATAAALQIDGLCVSARIGDRSYKALDSVALSVERGEARGLVGESGSGKSLTLRAVMGLLPPNLEVTGGAIRFRGQDLLADGGKLLHSIRGTGISMVFQEPAVALNPVMKVGQQIVDGVAWRRGLGRRQAKELAAELLTQVGIKDPEHWANAYPHQLSGGMRQRVMIASAIASQPEIILCDEPTTALDVTIQAQILKLFKALKTDLGAGLLYVTHDLSVVAEFCDSLTVMYAGRTVEQSDDLAALIAAPAHPYTRALLAAVPRIRGPVRRLRGLASSAPPLTEREQTVAPPMVPIGPGRQVAPFTHEDERFFSRDDEA